MTAGTTRTVLNSGEWRFEEQPGVTSRLALSGAVT